MMNKPYNTGQPEWEQILRSLEQGDEVSEDRFKKLSSDERALISEIKYNQKLKAAVDTLNAIDLKEDWGSIKNHLNLNETTGKGRIVNLSLKLKRYAAILALPILVGGIYFTLKPNHQPKELVAQKKEQVGFRKATLILGDGRSVELDANQSIKNSDGAKILVDATNALVYRREQNIEALPVYNTLVIPKGGEYKLVLSDGTEVWVNADTRIRYQVNFYATKTREVFLESGEAYFKVTKNPDKPFIVHNGNLKVQVLGTSFNMNSYSDNIQTTLVEGKVKVSSNNGKVQVELAPEQQANFKKTTGSLEKQDVDVYSFVAWKDGVLSFENETMTSLMEQIGRLYDYEIVFKDESLKKLHYSGSTDKSGDVQQILNIIQKTSKLKFTIKERSIVIEKSTKK